MSSELIAGLNLFNAYQQLDTPSINYSVLNMNADYLESQANDLDLKVTQEANLIRQQFIEAIGQVEYSAARRGVKVDEGNVRQNIEESSINLGKDIQTVRDNATFKQGQLRRGANRLRSASKYESELSLWRNIGNASSSILGATKAFPAYTELDAMKKASRESGIAYSKYGGR